MRAAYLERTGPPEVISYGSLPDPRPGPTDVLVAVGATTVNHVDTFVRSGAWRTPLPLPFVVGRDLAGVVVEAGPGAPGFAPGDRVWCNSLGHAGRQGAAAELAVVPADRLYPLPAGVADADVVAVAHPAVTAHLGLFRHARVRPGETVLVEGAAGNVGSALVTMAVDAGARVVATASARDLDVCRGLGADVVVDRDAPDRDEQLRAAAPDGTDVHLDTAGGLDLPAAVDRLAFRGRIVLLAGMGSRATLPVGPLYLKDGTVTGFTISRAGRDELAEAAVTVNRLLSSGALRPRRLEEMGLADTAEAHRRVEAGLMRGRRAVLRPEPAAAHLTNSKNTSGKCATNSERITS